MSEKEVKDLEQKLIEDQEAMTKLLIDVLSVTKK